MGRFTILLALFHLSSSEAPIKDEKITVDCESKKIRFTSYIVCYKDTKTQEIERLIMSVNPFTELEPDHFYKFSLKGKEQSRYILSKEGNFHVFAEDGKEKPIIGYECDPSNILIRTFTPSDDPFNADEDFFKSNSPSDDLTDDETWLVMEACFCLTWTILLVSYEIFGIWTKIIASKTRSIEICKRSYARKFGKIPRRYIS